MAGWTLGLLVGWSAGRFGERNGFAGRAQAGERNGFAGRDPSRNAFRIVRPAVDRTLSLLDFELAQGYAEKHSG